ncbi:venom acid phosphatase Acph-1-like [Apis dorsata]|uniref:venom acid phosphatase Acph-1-like n=1 Tax=Apis dorsata TaxID=7462 RepID=UPI0003DF65AC|nr:venom acid phosphatase Acph-1-like [Apis dorsata]
MSLNTYKENQWTLLIAAICYTKKRNFFQMTRKEFNVDLVQCIFRHGERTPRRTELPPNFTNYAMYEPWGLAQLTNEGKMTEFRIGSMLRERYNTFLGNHYYPSDVYAYSTDHDRTKTSLQLVLAGLFRPNPFQMWNQNLPWLPIPTYCMPSRVDHLLKPDSSPLYLKLLNEVRKEQKFIEKLKPYGYLFKYISENTGANVKTSHELYETYNQLVAQKASKLPLPEWYSEEIFIKLQDIVKIEYEIRSYTLLQKRLNGGTIIKRFIENIIINAARRNPRKIYLYSGHEVNIAALVKALNLSEPQLPPYGCAMIFEKLRNKDGKHYVRFLYWDTQKLVTCNLPGQDDVCPFEKYLYMIKDLIPTEDEAYHKWDYLTKQELRRLFDEIYFDIKY